MYGFNDQKLLSWMVEREVQQIGVGKHELVFRFFTDRESMTISFANGYKLRLIDDDPRYEAVVMNPGTGDPTIVV